MCNWSRENEELMDVKKEKKRVRGDPGLYMLHTISQLSQLHVRFDYHD